MRSLLFPIVNERNERLISIEEISDPNPFKSMLFQVSLVLAHHPLGIVLVKNKHKHIWELPGGYIETGEEAALCAKRELFEESGLIGENEVLLGGLQIESTDSDYRLLSCALFECQATGIALADNIETSDVAFWQVGSSIGPISAIDEAIVSRGLSGCT